VFLRYDAGTILETMPKLEAAFLVCLRYDAGTILETMPKIGDDHRTAFSEKL
jgi:hypothetical protein